MKNSATIESLKGMRFGAMATELERQLQDPATYAHMGFEERVALLVDAEWNSRQNNKLIRCIREARFAEPGAAVEDIEYYEDRHLDKAQLLRFTTCDFISKGHHIIFKGASGNGQDLPRLCHGQCRLPKAAVGAVYPTPRAFGGIVLGSSRR